MTVKSELASKPLEQPEVSNKDTAERRCVHDLFTEQAKRTPHAIAVTFEGRNLTYCELDERSNQLAQYLAKQGVKAEVLVGVCLERSLEMIVGLLGVLKAGGAYVPLDPDYPAERVAFMLTDANPPLVLTNEATRPILPQTASRAISLDGDWEEIARESTTTMNPAAAAENLAYVIYTSGSTGRPKGAMNTHAGIVNRLLWMTKNFPLDRDASVLQKTPFGFDISVWEFFWPLLTGARLVIARPGGHRDSRYLLELIRAEDITAVHFVPSMLRLFLQEQEVENCPPLRLVFCSGEALSFELQNKFFERMPGKGLHNLYGPTEAAVEVTHWACRPDSGLNTVPIGKPIKNIQIYILDGNLRQMPAGAPGELYIGGIGVARGYLNRDELTAEKFITDIFGCQPGAKLYRTGDLARFLPDGNIDFLGRIDDQVKIRGVRIELGEIESVLATHPKIKACAVVAGKDGDGEARLDAYLVMQGNQTSTVGELQNWLGQRLPAQMVPSTFACIHEMPLTPNGKLDRKSLAGTPGNPLAAGTPFVEPCNAIERRFCEIWQTVLNVKRVGIQDNFFELGGHSLQAMQVITRINQTLGTGWTAREIFERPTISRLVEKSMDATLIPAREGASRINGQPAHCVHELFAEQVRRTPETLAATCEGKSLTYLQIEQKSNQLANYLRQLGAGAGSLVCISLGRSLEQVIGLLGILKAGAAYVPIDPDYPVDRTTFMLADSNPVVVLTDQATRGRLAVGTIPTLCLDSDWERIAVESAEPPAISTKPEDLAYVIYTSGSTGRPKGVCMPHGPLVNLLMWQQEQSDYQPQRRTMNSTSPSFDVSFQEIFATICFGGCLVILPAQATGDVARMLELIEKAEIDRIFVPFVVLRALSDLMATRGGAPESLREIITAGEQLQITPNMRAQFNEGRIRLVNQYGPTETHVVTYFELAGPTETWPALPPIGKPINNVRLHILDERRQPVADGTPGELYLGGVAIARGYLNREDLTRERFVDNPFEAGTRLYRTGDLVRRPLDGELEFLGRIDQQIKIRGYRVEPGEIESVLGNFPKLAAAAVVAHDEEATGGKLLAAFVVPRPGETLTSLDIRNWLAAKLPSYMIPSVFYTVEALPLTPNGKVNRLALAATKGDRLPSGTQSIEPASQNEREVCRIWQELLHVDAIGIHDDFFDLGGHSLLAMQAMTRMNQHFGTQWSVRELFERPTVSELIELFNESQAAQTLNVELPPQTELNRCIHEFFADQVRRTPDAVAVIHKNKTLTYRQLNQRANQLAHHLVQLGIRPGMKVGVGMEHSLELVAAVIAVFRAGGTLVPIDVKLPEERVVSILTDARTSVVLADKRFAAHPPETEIRMVLVNSVNGEPSTDIGPIEISPEQAAYVVYTSGSTGRPKGVVVSQAAYLKYREAATAYFGIQAGDRVLQLMPYAFDAGLDQFLTPLLAGATVVQFTGILGDAERVTDMVRRDRLTMLHFPTVFWSEWVESLNHQCDPQALETLRLVQVGGEAMPVAAVKRWLGLGLRQVRLFNRYGPTETTMFATAYEIRDETHIDDQWNNVPLGRPVGPRTIHILDGERKPAAAGLAGEIHIGGETVADGYLGLPELTAERFIPDHVGNRADGRLYRTGDYGRILPDGNLKFIGRVDLQVKIRGYRVELEEIEAVLAKVPEIAAAVVVAQINGNADKKLAAFVVFHAGQNLSAADLRAWLAGRLPDYMIPSGFFFLEALPLTPNGKVDRKTLSATKGARPEGASEPIGPIEAIERQLCAIWQEILGVDSLGIQDNFFELGGNSLSAMRAVTQIKQVLGVELSVREFFEGPTISGLAKLLRKTSASHSTLSRQPSDVPTPALRAGRDSRPPLSFAQERLWFLAQYEPESTMYHVPQAWWLKGPLAIDRLEEAIGRLIERHEALRTTFELGDGGGVQIIAEAEPFHLPVLDLTGQAEVEATALKRMEENLRSTFNLATGPLLWAKLFRLGPQDHLLLVNMHHVISDGWSLGVFGRELSAIYNALCVGSEPQLPPLPWQYADYAIWQRQWLQGGELERQAGYWRRQLADAPVLELPTDFPRPARASYAAAKHRVSFSPELGRKLADFNRGAHLTPFMTLMAAFQVLLFRYSRQEDFLVGTPIANRQRLETEELIGFFVNTLAMRSNLSGAPSFRELARRVRTTALEAYQHQDMPFEEVVKMLNPVRDLSRNPLFQVLFAVQNAPEYPLELAGLEVTPEPIAEAATHFDLELHLWERGEQWTGFILYQTDLFGSGTIERMVEHYRVLLDSLLTNPDQPIARAALLTPAERHQLLVEWNQTQRDYPRDKCVHELFEEQAGQTPESVAVKCGERSLNYRELNQRANQLALELQDLGVGPEVLVGLCVERSVEMVVGVLGILKAGGAYVPLDLDYPKERIEFILKDTAAPVLVTVEERRAQFESFTGIKVCLDHGRNAERSPAVGKEANLTVAAAATGPAYVIYTSGSTGLPKGVVVTHRGIVRLVKNNDYIAFGPDDQVAQMANTSFDAATFEIWGALLNGATLTIIPTEVVLSPTDLANAFRQSRITTLFLTTSLFNQMAREVPSAFAGIGNVLFGGEAGDAQSVRRVLAGGAPKRLINGYGPTEVTTFTTWHAAEKLGEGALAVPIGRPISNTTVYILDSGHQPVPIGVTGELYAGGDGVARGYLNRPELTAERFIPDPFSQEPGAHLYKTGDLCRYLPDGTIEYLGRTDQQLKIRGFRIELGEIEAVLGTHPAVAGGAVVADANGTEKELAAYVVVRDGAELTAAGLRDWLGDKLPAYMVPARYATLPALPVTTNGKLDRRALEQMKGARPLAKGKDYQAPRTELERKLAGIWEVVLRRDQIGVQDDFFALGGHSLQAVRLAGEIARQLGRNVPIPVMFQAPTVESLAKWLTEREWTPAWSSLVPLRAEGSKPPLFLLHGLGGDVFTFVDLVKLLPKDQPCYGIQAVGLDGRHHRHTTMEQMAAHYVREIITFQPAGPYFLCGYSMGGLVAYEVASQLQLQGRKTALLCLVDSVPIGSIPWAIYLRLMPPFYLKRCLHHLRAWNNMPGKDRVNYLRGRWHALRFLLGRQRSRPNPMAEPPKKSSEAPQVAGFPDYYAALATAYRIGPQPVSADVFVTEETKEIMGVWKHLARGGVNFHPIRGRHIELLAAAQVPDFAKQLTVLLEQAQKGN